MAGRVAPIIPEYLAAMAGIRTNWISIAGGHGDPPLQFIDTFTSQALANTGNEFLTTLGREGQTVKSIEAAAAGFSGHSHVVDRGVKINWDGFSAAAAPGMDSMLFTESELQELAGGDWETLLVERMSDRSADLRFSAYPSRLIIKLFRKYGQPSTIEVTEFLHAAPVEMVPGLKFEISHRCFERTNEAGRLVDKNSNLKPDTVSETYS